MDDKQQAKEKFLESFDQFLATAGAQVLGRDYAMLDLFRQMIEHDAGAVAVIWAPKDLTEGIEFRTFSFHTEVAITFPQD